MKDKNKELSQNDNSLKYFIKLLFIAFIVLGIGIGIFTYIISIFFRIWNFFINKIYIENHSKKTKCKSKYKQ